MTLPDRPNAATTTTACTRRPTVRTTGPRADRGDRRVRRRGTAHGARRGPRTVARVYAKPDPVDPARRAAYNAVAAVHRDDAYANLALPSILRDAGLHGRDAAFATELTYGTLRAGGTIDAIIAIAADRGVDRIDPPARDALRLGVYQLLYTRVPTHAAVSATVDLVRSVAGEGASGFANAVMRQIAAKDLDDWLATVAPDRETDRVGYLVGHPAPSTVDRAGVRGCARRRPGRDRATADRGQRAPDRAPVRAAGPGGRDRSGRRGRRYAGRVLAVRRLPARRRAPGHAGGGALPTRTYRTRVRSSSRTRSPRRRSTVRIGAWLDLCAGPGGKAGLLGAIAAQRGAHVTAVEITPHRADLVLKTTRGLPVTVVCADGRDVGAIDELPAGGFDRVLVDAPCSGLGSLRRRPEARWRRTPSDLPPLTRLQRELLAAALRAVRPGGVVAYVTCSPHIAETQVTVTESARRAPFPVEFVDARALLPDGMPGLGTGPTVQLWPHRHGTDAMFLAVLRRTE